MGCACSATKSKINPVSSRLPTKPNSPAPNQGLPVNQQQHHPNVPQPASSQRVIIGNNQNNASHSPNDSLFSPSHYSQNQNSKRSKQSPYNQKDLQKESNTSQKQRKWANDKKLSINSIKSKNNQSLASKHYSANSQKQQSSQVSSQHISKQGSEHYSAHTFGLKKIQEQNMHDVFTYNKNQPKSKFQKDQIDKQESEISQKPGQQDHQSSRVSSPAFQSNEQSSATYTQNQENRINMFQPEDGGVLDISRVNKRNYVNQDDSQYSQINNLFLSQQQNIQEISPDSKGIQQQNDQALINNSKRHQYQQYKRQSSESLNQFKEQPSFLSRASNNHDELKNHDSPHFQQVKRLNGNNQYIELACSPIKKDFRKKNKKISTQTLQRDVDQMLNISEREQALEESEYEHNQAPTPKKGPSQFSLQIQKLESQRNMGSDGQQSQIKQNQISQRDDKQKNTRKISVTQENQPNFKNQNSLQNKHPNIKNSNPSSHDQDNSVSIYPLFANQEDKLHDDQPSFYEHSLLDKLRPVKADHFNYQIEQSAIKPCSQENSGQQSLSNLVLSNKHIHGKNQDMSKIERQDIFEESNSPSILEQQSDAGVFAESQHSSNNKADRSVNINSPSRYHYKAFKPLKRSQSSQHSLPKDPHQKSLFQRQAKETNAKGTNENGANQQIQLQDEQDPKNDNGYRKITIPNKKIEYSLTSIKFINRKGSASHIEQDVNQADLKHSVFNQVRQSGLNRSSLSEMPNIFKMKRKSSSKALVISQKASSRYMNNSQKSADGTLNSLRVDQQKLRELKANNGAYSLGQQSQSQISSKQLSSNQNQQQQQSQQGSNGTYGPSSRASIHSKFSKSYNQNKPQSSFQPKKIQNKQNEIKDNNFKTANQIKVQNLNLNKSQTEKALKEPVRIKISRNQQELQKLEQERQQALCSDQQKQSTLRSSKDVQNVQNAQNVEKEDSSSSEQSDFDCQLDENYIFRHPRRVTYLKTINKPNANDSKNANTAQELHSINIDQKKDIQNSNQFQEKKSDVKAIYPQTSFGLLMNQQNSQIQATQPNLNLRKKSSTSDHKSEERDEHHQLSQSNRGFPTQNRLQQSTPRDPCLQQKQQQQQQKSNLPNYDTSITALQQQQKRQSQSVMNTSINHNIISLNQRNSRLSNSIINTISQTKLNSFNNTISPNNKKYKHNMTASTNYDQSLNFTLAEKRVFNNGQQNQALLPNQNQSLEQNNQSQNQQFNLNMIQMNQNEIQNQNQNEQISKGQNQGLRGSQPQLSNRGKVCGTIPEQKSSNNLLGSQHKLEEGDLPAPKIENRQLPIVRGFKRKESETDIMLRSSKNKLSQIYQNSLLGVQLTGRNQPFQNQRASILDMNILERNIKYSEEVQFDPSNSQHLEQSMLLNFENLNQIYQIKKSQSKQAFGKRQSSLNVNNSIVLISQKKKY